MSDTKYIASFSGGKDSTATVILAHEHNEPIKFYFEKMESEG